MEAYTLQAMSSSQKTLFLFDFDDTLVEGWADSRILQVTPSLCLENRIPQLFDQFGSWCVTMDSVMHIAHENGLGKDEVVDCMKKMELKHGIGKFLRRLSTDFPEVDAMVLSDGNTQFINIALEEAGCSHSIMKVYANNAVFDENGRLRITAYHSHDCQKCKKYCPLNDSCKGTMLSSILSMMKYNRIVYIGDGMNDVCPCLLLTSNDIIVARECYPLAKELSMITDLKPQLVISDFDTSEIETVLASLVHA